LPLGRAGEDEFGVVDAEQAGDDVVEVEFVAIAARDARGRIDRDSWRPLDQRAQVRVGELGTAVPVGVSANNALFTPLVAGLSQSARTRRRQAIGPAGLAHLGGSAPPRTVTELTSAEPESRGSRLTLQHEAE